MLSKSLSILTANPVLLAPLLITFAIGLFNDLINASYLAPLSIVVDVVSFVVSIIVYGGYPFMVKAIVDGGPVAMTEAFGRAFHKFWTLLAAGILVAVIVALGFILIVPGLIFLTWYVYTIPAIMLEDKGALEGMAASKSFGHDKKWSTFSMLLALGVAFLVLYIPLGLLTLLGLRLLGEVMTEVLYITISAWTIVTISYTYITHGPSSVMATAGTPGYGMTSPTWTQQPSLQAGTPSPRNFFSSCGSPLQSGARFCPNCGKPV